MREFVNTRGKTNEEFPIKKTSLYEAVQKKKNDTSISTNKVNLQKEEKVQKEKNIQKEEK